MKITVFTEYENVTEEWLNWYLTRLAKGPAELKLIAINLKSGQTEASFSSSHEGLIATTTYKIER